MPYIKAEIINWLPMMTGLLHTYYEPLNSPVLQTEMRVGRRAATGRICTAVKGAEQAPEWEAPCRTAVQ